MTKIALPLTDRETQILNLVRDGLTGKEIAAGLDISQNTVKFHLANILYKTGAVNSTQAVVTSIRCGFIYLTGGQVCQIKRHATS